MQAFSCLATLPASALVIACPATNPWSLSPTRGDTPVKSTHACFPHSHPKTRMSAGRSVDLPSNGSVKKFTKQKSKWRKQNTRFTLFHRCDLRPRAATSGILLFRCSKNYKSNVNIFN
ncbi:hypothetical protein Hanom_Chr11g01033161 [Helianthus anomalus]